MRPEAPRQLAQRLDNTPSTRGSTQLSPVALERFDDYVVVAKLGVGGMAEVFLALAPGPSGFRKLHVIKRLHAHMNDDPQFVAMFLQEASLAARLHHPNVVQTNHVGSHQGQHYLAMEYLDGQPLNRILKRLHVDGSILPPALSVRIVSEALAGLGYAHGARDYDGTPLGIIHRDVSPHNIFVTYDGQVKLLDFGIAKASASDSHTRTGIIKGKCSYIAPEQARGEHVDRRADLWSMGVTLWECLAGERLFRGQSEIDILRSTLSDEIPLLTEVAEHVPEQLANTLHRALQRDRERRIASAELFKTELDGWLVGQGQAGSSEALGAMMQGLFADKIAERRAVLRACLARVSEVEEAKATRVRGTPQPLPPVLIEQPERGPGLKWAVGVALVVLLVGGFSLRTLGVFDDDEPSHAASAASAQVEPIPARPAASTRAVKEPPAVLRDQAPVPQPKFAPLAPAPALTRANAEPPVRTVRPVRKPMAPLEPPAAKTKAPLPVLAEQVHQSPEPSVEPPGRLVLDSAPYAIVYEGERRLGITPIDVELPEGTHVLTLRNPEQQLETTYRVTVPAGARVERRVGLE